jgi:catechol-2,3-dioxygenase
VIEETAMTCLHVDLHVTDLEAGIRFYTRTLGSEPCCRDDRRAQWQRCNPCVGLTIATDMPPRLGAL